MNEINFEFSDTIAGYVTEFNQDHGTFKMKTSDGREFEVELAANTYAQVLRNMEEPYVDATGLMPKMLVPGRFLYAYGTYYPERGGHTFEAKSLVFVGRGPTDYNFEKQDWWIKQVASLGDHYLRWQFGDDPVDYANYRTILYLAGQKQKDDFRQETDTISRLVYGFASAYLMTGDDRYLVGAEKGTEYLRDHMRFLDTDEGIVYWYHGIELQGRREQKIFASEFGDDYDAIPAYEQIYALAGPIQTYRITGDPRILSDAEQTIKLFNNFFLDKEAGGYFSHIDPVTLDPRAESLGRNRGRKNWNSVGDHAPAYLINLWLATGEQEYADMLVSTADTIEGHFQDYEHSPFVQEKFFEDWSRDQVWGWQQNRAVVGHNLKIAWNLMRINSLRPNEKYVAMAKKIAELMPKVGGDPQRGGWYDMMERTLSPGQEAYRFAWHDRKPWWQQEQGILAYMILNGVLGGDDYLRLARESAAFYNAWFIDHNDGGVYFMVMNNGLPYLLDHHRFKGSHSMSNYHASELCYLAATYNNLLISKQPMDFYFKPRPDGFKDRILRVSPDILPPGSIRLDQVWINDEAYTNFNAEELTVKLPDVKESVRVKVRIVPTR